RAQAHPCRLWRCRSSAASEASSASSHPLRDLAAELVLEVDTDDLLEARFSLEAQRERAPGVEIARPAGNDLLDEGIRLAPDALDHLLAGDLAQGLDLLPHGHGQTRHGEVAPRTDLLAVDRRRMQ